MAKSKATRILVCGSRDYPDKERVYEVLDAYFARVGPRLMIISGGATGADSFARQWAVEQQVDHVTLYAKWDLEGKGAGPIRNRRMAKLRPKLVLAFSKDFDKSRGTSDMIRVAEKNDIKVKKFN